MHSKRTLMFGLTLVVLLTVATPLLKAQTGKLKVNVQPKQAYVFVDGRAMGYGRQTITLSAGPHRIDVYNYGYKTATQNVTVGENQTTEVQFTLEPIPGTTSGPWGRIQIEGGDRAAVLLNGKTPEYFVGHADEFNHNIGWKQELLVPPGTHQLTLLKDQQEIWSGKVTVEANQRAIVFVDKGDTQRMTPWPRGGQLGSVPYFRAGVASATVAVMPVTAQFSVGPVGQAGAAQTEINCGGTAQLKWDSNGAVKREMSGQGEVASSGELAVQPKQTTTYTLTASGPGGTSTQNVTVTVNSAIQASLSASPAQVRYRRVGDQVVEQGRVTLSWSASGADGVMLDTLGEVGSSGSRTLELTPRQQAEGPIDETLTYTLRATNACGGSEIRTARVRLSGAIEPPPSAAAAATLETKLAMNSVYFPTAQPTVANPQGGLVASQQRVLSQLAQDFVEYLKYKPEARLIIQAHADTRGSKEYNRALSERRANRVRDFLVAQGVPAASLETRAFGKEENLSAEAVQQLEEQNPNLTAAERARVIQNLNKTVLANNRRVDLRLSTTGQTSVKFFPHNAEDAKDLMGLEKK